MIQQWKYNMYDKFAKSICWQSWWGFNPRTGICKPPNWQYVLEGQIILISEEIIYQSIY